MTDLYPVLAEADFSQPSQQQELPEPLPPEKVRAACNNGFRTQRRCAIGGSMNQSMPWEESLCNVPVWSVGAPSGFCGKKAYGHQMPSEYLKQIRGNAYRPYCFGHACDVHGGPKENEARIFQDGVTDQGRPMWCAVMPGFINLQESPAGFSGDPIDAIAMLNAEIKKSIKGSICATNSN